MFSTSKRFFSTVGLLLVCGWLALPTAFSGRTEAAPPTPPKSASPSTSTLPPPATPHAEHESMELQVASLVKELNFPALWSKNSGAAWAALLISLSVGLVASWACGLVLRRLGERFQQRRWAGLAKLMLDLIGPAKLVLLTVALTAGLAGLEMSDPLRELLAKKMVKLLYCVAVMWYVYNVVGLVDLGFQRLVHKRESLLDRQLAPLVRKSLRCFLAVLAVLFVVDSVFEQDIRAWLAGLGIVGLGVSLAAQDSIKNLFGSLTILFDRPFQIGDRIVFAGYDGTIEDIGFRSTKIRATSGNIITIPNSKIVNDSVENVSRRPYIRRAFNVTLPARTPSDALQRAVTSVREVLAQPEIAASLQAWEEGKPLEPRVYLGDWAEDKIHINVTYWYSPPLQTEYLAHAQLVNLRILGRLECDGIAVCGLATPPKPGAAPPKPATPAPAEEA